MTTTQVEPMNIDTEDSSSPIDNQFSAILNTLCQFKTQITAISTQMKTLEKTVKREIKQHKKEVIKKQAKGNRKPSGFAAASPISEELCDFMGKERGTSIARTEVTKFICSYIDENSLRNAENKRVIIPDDKLKNLLDPDADTVLTYFNIQRFMNKHFIKKTAVSSK
jgi:upstream activation factor subunit UAF30